MKSTSNQLLGRGMIYDGRESDYQRLSFSDQLLLLKSSIAFERTIAARLLGRSEDASALAPLCNALRKEHKLYTKIEICNALVAFGILAVPFLIPMLGTIGNNQYKEVPTSLFKKRSYPLPRDIVARILIRIGPAAISSLKNDIVYIAEEQVSEAIDIIGYINFYHINKDGFQTLITCFEKFKDNNLIVWKIVRALSAFPVSGEFLTKHNAITTNLGIKQEIERSLKSIKC